MKGVPMEILRPETAWVSSGQAKKAFLSKAREMGTMFNDIFKVYADK
jgi:hypothetical protein